jgi:hypothetical protein
LSIHRFGAILISLTLVACAGQPGAIQNKLDPATAVTITYSQTPMVFYRDDSGKAAFARNYLHLGPLEVNRMGSFHYYLWLGIWNTMQDAEPGESRNGFESIVIYVDGEPLALELTGWTPAAIGATEPVYLRPVASAADAYYEVTVDHLRLIAASDEVRIQSTGPGTRTYELWDKQKAAKKSLDEFLRNSVY